MPAFDKPLDQLKQYLGTNDRPDDFQAYWAEALAELDCVDPKPELIRNTDISPLGVECFDLWFTGAGGARIYSKYLRPKGKRNCPVAFAFHGYSANSGDWADKLVYPCNGLCLAAMDCRGQGGLSEDVGGVKGTTLRGHIIRGLEDPDPAKLLFRQVFLDTVQLVRVVSSFEEVDSNRMATFGRSQGGGLALVCAALEPRIKRVVSKFPFLCDYQRVWEMDLAQNAYEELRLFFRRHDPTHERKEHFFRKLGYVDVQHHAPQIQAEVLMLTGLMDKVCPPSTQFAAYNKIRSPKEMILYPDYEHEVLPGESDRIFRLMMGL